MCARWKTILYDSSSALSEPQPTYVDTPLLAKVFEKAHVSRYIVLMIHRVVDVRGRSIVMPHAFFFASSAPCYGAAILEARTGRGVKGLIKF